jgi:purine-binding chemotaxis protein CheW
MKTSDQDNMALLEFVCAENKLALPISIVERVVQAAALTTLPGAPKSVLGLLNLHGEFIPVLSLFAYLGLPIRPVEPSQQIILIDTSNLRMGVLTDQVRHVFSCNAHEMTAIPPQFQAAGFVNGVVRMDNGIQIICDPEKFLLSEDRLLLAEVLERVCHASD